MALLGLVLPSRCAGCDAPGAAAVRRRAARRSSGSRHRCASAAGAPAHGRCRRCVECAGRRLAFARARAAIVYDARARPLVSAWKERGRRDLAAALAELVVEARSPGRPWTALTFVPGDRERGRERGHVPAQRLADALGVRWGIPVAAASRAHRRLATAGRVAAGGAASERPRRVRGVEPCASERRARRRRLHDRRDRVCLRDRAPAGRSAAGRGGLPRAGSAVALEQHEREAPMRLKVTVRHGQVNDDVRSYVESKFAKLGRRLHDRHAGRRRARPGAQPEDRRRPHRSRPSCT